ncbi:MAG: putative internalin [Myxococcaceae bacterium]|nr:putative internalin [Myxococcaceae bacterium]
MRTPFFIALFASLLLSTSALAQGSGFSLDRFQPAPTSEDGLALILPRTLGHLRPSFGLTLDYAHQPLVIARPGNDPDSAPVKHRLVGHFSAAIGLGSRLEVFVRAPVLLMQLGDTAGSNGGGSSVAHSGAFGALQLGASARLLGADEGPFALGATAWVETPTGSREHLTGDHGVGVGGVLSGSYNTRSFGLAANAGGRYRQKDSFGTARIGSELLLGAGAYLYVSERVTILSELNGAISARDAGAKTQNMPFELLAGARYATPLKVLVTGAAGLGLSHAVGVPDARALLQLAYPNPRPAGQSADADHDGIPDSQDDCPERAEDMDGFQDRDGCPELDNDQDGIADVRDQCSGDPEDLDGIADDDGCPDPDNDHDGVVDAQDQCPNAAEDMDGFQDDDGCPDLDNDKDSLVDARDQCPLQPEDLDGFEDEDGCPDPDNDKDGVLDVDDGCPTVPGPAATQGCPSAVRMDKQQLRILERIEFQTMRAEIRPESLGILDQIRGALEVNPQLRRVRIEGHTDDVGSTASNEKLSQRRAESVMKYLIKEGIDPSRLEAKGWGEERPLVKNDSAENKQINRRVEFHIVDPAPPQSSLGGAQ